MHNMLFAIYLIPIIIWPISLHPTFTLIEKIICCGIFSLIFIGFELVIKDTKLTKKEIPFKKLKYIIPDLNLSIFSLLSPQVTTSLILGTTVGGTISYIFLYQNLFSFLTGGIMTFIIILGIEFLFQDLVMKPNNVSNNNIISYCINATKIIPFIKQNSLTCMIGLLGSVCFYTFYDNSLLFSVIGFCLFAFIFTGVTKLK
tara:strand:+ start:780 stop:1382 length:603 start_codon:yes stop_codon:yes gene_type:complete